MIDKKRVSDKFFYKYTYQQVAIERRKVAP